MEVRPRSGPMRYSSAIRTHSLFSSGRGGPLLHLEIHGAQPSVAVAFQMQPDGEGSVSGGSDRRPQKFFLFKVQSVSGLCRSLVLAITSVHPFLPRSPGFLGYQLWQLWVLTACVDFAAVSS